MSCQQATRLITTTNASATSKTREDPYVFSETVSTTPPILFNVQKSRVKIPESFNVSSTYTKSTHQKLPLTQLNVFTAKTSATLANLVSVTTASTNFKNEQNRKPAPAKVSISRTKQPQQQQQQHLQQTSLPTPSLWQTPLLLESIVSPPTSPASLPSPPKPTPTPAPAVVSPNASATLPPSNFHHTTFAQHLQKVGCIRKSPPAHAHKERNNANVSHSNGISKQAAAARNNVVTTTATSVAGTVTATIPKPQNFTSSSEPSSHHKHSENDINEIPVNVIYRNPQANADITSNLLSAKLQKESQRTDIAATEATDHPTIATSQCSQASANLQPDTAGCLNGLAQKTTESSIADTPTTFATATPQTLNIIYKPPAATPVATATKAEKCLQTDVFTVSSKSTPRRKVAPPSLSKKALLSQSQENGKCVRSLTLDPKPTAFAVVTCSAGSQDALGSSDEAQQAPACFRQQHWLGVYDLRMTAVGGFNSITDRTPSEMREERITQHKSILRRQATQLLAMRTLLQSPLQAARRRLVCVDRLLRKHEDHREDDYSTASCDISDCNNLALPMTTHCYEHIGYNADQQLFLTCTAKFSDNSQCRVPVFDIVHDLPLCPEHARKRDTYNRIWHEQHPLRKDTTTTANVALSSVSNPEDEYRRHLQQQQQQQQQLRTPTMYIYNPAVATKPSPQRNNKRKQCSSASTAIKPVGRPQKRMKKTTYIGSRANAPTPAPPPLSAVKQRKSSNTSLESIASNSHSSHSQPPFGHTSTANVLAPPALAPLSGSNATRYIQHHHSQQQQQPQHYDYIGRVGGGGGLSASAACGDGFNSMLTFGSNSAAATHEINQIVAQFAMVANDNNSSSHTDFSSGLSLPSADEILTQDMLSICENSSAYASSEDTGVGGLSETELMTGSGAHDAEEIPLGDTRLLEEHDLANVLNTLPVDAFNELFTVVRQDERDEVERALEIADKHLKSLQQTIGSDSDFLGDFLNVNDHMLDDNDICSKMGIVSSVLHSPDTSGIDTATLFGVEGGAGSGGGGCSNGVADMRGLVQT